MNQVVSDPPKSSRLPSWFRHNGDPFASFQEELDRLMERFGRGFHHEQGSLVPSPRADLKETDTALVMTVDLPGYEEKDIDVTLAENRLTIKGHTETTEEKEEGDYHFSERRLGDVSRMVTLPCEIEADKVDAKVKDGVLTVTLPKSKASKAQTKRIKVKRET